METSVQGRSVGNLFWVRSVWKTADPVEAHRDRTDRPQRTSRTEPPHGRVYRGRSTSEPITENTRHKWVAITLPVRDFPTFIVNLGSGPDRPVVTDVGPRRVHTILTVRDFPVVSHDESRCSAVWEIPRNTESPTPDPECSATCFNTY